ncbi:MAG: RagB/SusD family nutrient uptake outer membrane protein [Bacteroidales bacterium]|nr:RagB/SusD family nutrient uptake outer membrane protein [Bacteroidales bacterium]
MNRLFKAFFAVIALVAFSSCDKFLDKMPDNRAEVSSQEKVRALLASAYSTGTYLFFSEYMSDNVDNLGDDNPGTNRFVDQCYTWTDVTETDNDSPKYFWEGGYDAINHANYAIYAIQQLAGCEDELSLKAVEEAGLTAELAEALLCRAFHHFLLVNFFSLNYNSNTSDKDLGIPYIEEISQELNPHYDRGTVSEVYEKIATDLEIALRYVSDEYYQIPKYHFNVKAAYAFASRFYLFYEKWDLAAEYATKCLGSQPGQVLRNWKYRNGLERDREVKSNDFIKSSYDANLLLMTAYTAFGWYMAYPGITKYSHSSYLCFTEGAYAAHAWGNTQTGWRYIRPWYWDGPEWYSGSNFDQIVYFKIPYLFEYTDPVARTGYAHAVYPVLTTDETLLNRAEAYVMMGRYDEAAEDLNTWAHNIIDPQYFSFALTPEYIQEFFSKIDYWTPEKPTIKKKLNPAFPIGTDNDLRECMLQCVLNFKRLENMAQGLRWLDIKRYGIEIYRRTLEPDSSAGQYDAGFKVMNGRVDSLMVNDPRRAMQIPPDIISAGIEPNPR